MKKKDTDQDLAQGFAPGQTAPAPPPSAPPAVAPKRLSALDIQQKEFRVSRFGGYRMRDVDEFLDQITEAMSAMSAESQRLRGTAGSGAVVGTPDLEDVNRQADEIIQRARAEAARILADARSKSGATGAPSTAVPGGRAPAVVGAFLTHEKEFLQSLASLVQDHAESVKSMAKAARSAGPTPAPAVPTPAVPAPPASAPRPTTSRSEAPPREESRAARAVPASAEPTLAVPKVEEPVRVEEPEPASVSRTEGEEPAGDEAGDSSLRELFWGED